MGILAYRTAGETKSARTEQARADLVLSVEQLDAYAADPSKHTLFVKGSTFRTLNKDAWHYGITSLFMTCIARYTEIKQEADAARGFFVLEGHLHKWEKNEKALQIVEQAKEVLSKTVRPPASAGASAAASTSPSQSRSSSAAQAAASSASASPVPSPESPHLPRAFSANEEMNLLFWEAKKKELEANKWPWQAIKHIEAGILASEELISWSPESFERQLNSFIENVPAEIWNNGEPFFDVVGFIQMISRAEPKDQFNATSYLIKLGYALLEASVLDEQDYGRLIRQAHALPSEERTKGRIDELFLTFVQENSRTGVPFPKPPEQLIPASTSAPSASRPIPVRRAPVVRPVKEGPHSMSPISVIHYNPRQRKRANSEAEAVSAAADQSSTTEAQIPVEPIAAAPAIASPTHASKKPLFGHKGTYNWNTGTPSFEDVIENP